MAYDEKLAIRIRKAVSGKKGFVEKKMFGGLGFLLNGNMCVGIWKESLIARLDPEDYDSALQRAGVREFDITGRAMSGWVMIAPEALARQQLRKWIDRSVHYVSALPAK